MAFPLKKVGKTEERKQAAPNNTSTPLLIHPRRLLFRSPSNNNNNKIKIVATSDDISDCEEFIDNPMKKTPVVGQTAISPPCRKVQALRLFENSPATPKTILQKSGKFLNKNHLSSAVVADLHRLQEYEIPRPLPLPLHNRVLDNAMHKVANVNPFTPDSLMAHNKKRCRTQFGHENMNNRSLQLFLNSDHDTSSWAKENGDVDQADMHQAPKRLALQDTNISRYQKEFVEISLIGVGEFGLVFQCLNRLDGCVYAIKKSIKPVAGSFFEKRALNEVWAHAVLGKHDNVVRYYSAWAEDNHMLIQNEYCNGGSLQAYIQQRFLAEAELRILLLHVAEGLRYIHSNDLVHMDLKSGNIFLTKVPSIQKGHGHSTTTAATTTPMEHDDDDGIDGMASIYEELHDSECIVTYKIGDLGHVTSVNEAQVEEGDCRYLSNEILQEDYTDLFKADIFSLGIMLYEAAGGGPLPKNGDDWHKLRDGEVPDIPNLSADFNNLIKLMTHPEPEKRPSSTSIFNHPILSSLESKTKLQLSQELAIEKRKNQILLQKLCEAKNTLKSYRQNKKGISLNSPQQPKQEQPSQQLSEPRILRSYARKKRSLPLPNKMDRFRDRNKNIIVKPF